MSAQYPQCVAALPWLICSESLRSCSIPAIQPLWPLRLYIWSGFDLRTCVQEEYTARIYCPNILPAVDTFSSITCLAKQSPLSVAQANNGANNMFWGFHSTLPKRCRSKNNEQNRFFVSRGMGHMTAQIPNVSVCFPDFSPMVLLFVFTGEDCNTQKISFVCDEHHHPPETKGTVRYQKLIISCPSKHFIMIERHQTTEGENK